MPSLSDISRYARLGMQHLPNPNVTKATIEPQTTFIHACQPPSGGASLCSCGFGSGINLKVADEADDEGTCSGMVAEDTSVHTHLCLHVVFKLGSIYRLAPVLLVHGAPVGMTNRLIIQLRHLRSAGPYVRKPGEIT